VAHTFLHGITSFFCFRSPLGLAVTLPLLRDTGLHRPALSMADDNAGRLAYAEAASAVQQHITNKMAALQAAEKKTAEAHARVRAITLLLEEEQASVIALEAQDVMAVL
jgi:hypothetical protein